MPKLPASGSPTTATATQSATRPERPRGQGRLVKQGTVLAREMTLRRMRKSDVTAAMRCSDRQLYNYMARRAPVPLLELAALCRLLRANPKQLVDEQRYLLEV